MNIKHVWIAVGCLWVVNIGCSDQNANESDTGTDGDGDSDTNADR